MVFLTFHNFNFVCDFFSFLHCKKALLLKKKKYIDFKDLKRFYLKVPPVPEQYHLSKLHFPAGRHWPFVQDSRLIPQEREVRNIWNRVLTDFALPLVTESCPQELKIYIILQNIPFQVIQEDWIKAPKLKTISKSSTPCSQATLKALAAQDWRNEPGMFLNIIFLRRSAICSVPPARHGRSGLETCNLVNQGPEFHSLGFLRINYQNDYCQKALQAVTNPLRQVTFGQTLVKLIGNRIGISTEKCFGLYRHYTHTHTAFFIISSWESLGVCSKICIINAGMLLHYGLSPKNLSWFWWG